MVGCLAMSEIEFWGRFALGGFATWRVTHLLACEDGPADVLARLRALLGDSFVGKLMDCFQCLSFWVAAPAAFFVAQRPLDLVLTWLALSGVACLLERLGQEPVVMEPVTTQPGAVNDGMLRPETGADQTYVVDAAGDTHAASSQAEEAADESEH